MTGDASPRVIPAPVDDDGIREISSLARDLADGYAALVESYRRSWGITQAEADIKAREGDPSWTERLVEDPPDQLSWWSLARLIEHDPTKGIAVWERVKAQARDELASGHRAGRTIEHGSDPWQRAQFLALRTAFRAEWQPRGGIEAALIDAMAQAFTGYLGWLDRLDVRATSDAQIEDHKLKELGAWQPPRLSAAQGLEQAAEMAERFHRMFLRSLRALQELRRLPTVHVTSAAQINVAGPGGQQLNLAARTDPATAVPTPDADDEER